MEIVDTANLYFKRKAEEEKEHWKRTRWLVYWIVNIQGKYLKEEIKETELGIVFDDEAKKKKVKKLSPKKMRKRAIELGKYHMEKVPGFIKRAKDGGPKIYGED